MAHMRDVSRSSRYVGYGVAMDALVRQTTGRGRTAKSCGPDAAMLASSLRSDPQVTVTTSPLTGESAI